MPGAGTREDTSRQYRTSAPTSGSVRRSRTVAWISRHRPSACRTRAVRTAKSSAPLGGASRATASEPRSSGCTVSTSGRPSAQAGSRPRRSATAWETKVTRSFSSTMTTGSTLLFTRVRNEDWLRCRSPASRCWRRQSTACEPIRTATPASATRTPMEPGTARMAMTMALTTAATTTTARERRAARCARIGARPGMQPLAAPGRGRWSRGLDRDVGRAAAASVTEMSPVGVKGAPAAAVERSACNCAAMGTAGAAPAARTSRRFPCY